MTTESLAAQALQLLFKKLHPLLEDTAHALERGADASALIRLHGKLQVARDRACDVLGTWAEEAEDPALAEILGTLASNLAPLGEPFQQSLILTQLCLEEAPAELLPFLPEGTGQQSTWWPRMQAFLKRLEDPGYRAEARWADLDPDLGDDGEEP